MPSCRQLNLKNLKTIKSENRLISKLNLNPRVLSALMEIIPQLIVYGINRNKRFPRYTNKLYYYYESVSEEGK